MSELRIGVDFGGTKIEAAALDGSGECVVRLRAPTPATYTDALTIVKALVERVERATARVDRIGVGAPGSPAPFSGLIRNANTRYLNGRPFAADLSATLARPVRLSNDANCLALSESRDGAASGAAVVFAVILGTGCGGGLAVHGRLIEGANGIAGEWGHNALARPALDETPGPPCWCGREGCLETWISGSGLRRDYRVQGGDYCTGQEIVDRARRGEPAATVALDRYVDRLSRALAAVVNLLDPDVFVFGGGMANFQELYEQLPGRMRNHIFADQWSAALRLAKWGDSSGVRGAARLWDNG